VSVVTKLRRRRRALLLQRLYHTTMALYHPHGTELMESKTSTNDRVIARPASIHDESVAAVAASTAASAVAVAFGYSHRLADDKILFDTGPAAAAAASKQETPKHAHDPHSRHHLIGSERLRAVLDSYSVDTAQEADDPQQPTSSFAPGPASASASASAVEAPGRFWQPPPPPQQQIMAEGADPYLDRARLTQPAPPNYQLSERSQKISTDHYNHNRRRQQLLLQQPQQQQQWGQHFGISPGAYAMPGNGTMGGDERGVVDDPTFSWTTTAPTTRPLLIGWKRPTLRLISMVLLLFVIVVAAIVTTVSLTTNTLKSKNGKNSHRVEPNDSATENTTSSSTSVIVNGDDLYLALLPLLEQSTLNASVLLDSGSPQGKAAHWLAYDDLVTTTLWASGIFGSARITQRYILAVLYFSTNGGGDQEDHEEEEDSHSSSSFFSSWRDRYNFLSPLLDECNWTTTFPNVLEQHGGRQAGVSCNLQSHVTSIVMGAFQ
jgi:hypothetical protein